MYDLDNYLDGDFALLQDEASVTDEGPCLCCADFSELQTPTIGLRLQAILPDGHQFTHGLGQQAWWDYELKEASATDIGAEFHLTANYAKIIGNLKFTLQKYEYGRWMDVKEIIPIIHNRWLSENTDEQLFIIGFCACETPIYVGGSQCIECLNEDASDAFVVALASRGNSLAAASTVRCTARK